MKELRLDATLSKGETERLFFNISTHPEDYPNFKIKYWIHESRWAQTEVFSIYDKDTGIVQSASFTRALKESDASV